jgi:hypothetical protein
VPGPALTTEALVLLKHPPAESFQALAVFSAEHGALRVLQRVPRKPNPQHLPLDLFDEVALTLEAGSSGTWFLKEARLLHRFTEIGRRYETLLAASAFTRLIARNPVQEESRAAVHHLLRTALSAFATSDRPDVVGFKSLYCFARDEGHPLKQHWFPTLPEADRADVQQLLTRPVADQTVPTARVAHLQRRLEEYLRGHTEIWVGGEERKSVDSG